jgi:phage/plasmid-like protein (TIGR03299 family)
MSDPDTIDAPTPCRRRPARPNACTPAGDARTRPTPQRGTCRRKSPHMAHLISNASITGKSEAFYALQPAWHGLGTVLDYAPTSADAIEAAGLAWEVQRLPLVAQRTIATPEGNVVRDIDVADHFANVRSDTGAILGVVGKGYKIVQNRDAFAFLDSLLQDGLMRYESAGALKDGRMIWVLARLPSVDTIAPGDDVRRYVVFSTAHDGTGAVRAFLTATRVVCWNTLSASMRDARGAGELQTIRHSGDIAGKLDAARQYLSQFDKAFTLHASHARALATTKATPADVRRFVDTLLPEVKDGRGKTIRDNDVASIYANLASPRQTVGGIGGTWWSAYNAVSELIDHGSTTRGEDDNARAENRFMANIGLHGRAAAFKRNAFDTALQFAGVA